MSNYPNAKRIEYSSHLELKMEIRGIPKTLPKKIFKEATEKYLDTDTSYYIALTRV